MRNTKVVIVGAASGFGPAMLADAALTPALAGSTIALVDIDEERLEVMAAYGERLSDATGAGLRIEHTTDRTEALPDAEFVITCVAVDRDKLWGLDWSIPRKYGIKQILAENGGPGGLSHALRNIPIILGIAKDIERLAPHALLLDFTNPVSRIALALSRYTSLRFAGLCHGIGMAYDSISTMTGIPESDLRIIAAGLNHFAWVLDVRRNSTQEDVYPILREADKVFDPAYFPLTRRLFRAYGLYPHPADDHIGEYLSFAWEDVGLKGPDLEEWQPWREMAQARLVRLARGEEPIRVAWDATPEVLRLGLGDPDWQAHRSVEVAFPIIAATLENRQEVIEAVNITNGGLIPNLPDWAVVEVPAVVGADGVKGVHVGPLPKGIAALLNAQVHVQDLVVDAAVLGSRELALQALLADPVVQSAEAAEKCLDELLATHAPYLPQFSQ